jgi:hypothetical protein
MLRKLENPFPVGYLGHPLTAIMVPIRSVFPPVRGAEKTGVFLFFFSPAVRFCSKGFPFVHFAGPLLNPYHPRCPQI